MNTIAEQILDGLVPGIVSGLVTSVILLISLKYWTHVFIPWFEKRVYCGIRIDRKWRIRHDNTTPGPAEITVTQSAHRISGIILWQEAGTTTEYVLTGEFSDLILTASYKQRDANTLDRGTITLLCLQNGQVLKGCYAWYDISTSQIKSGTYEWYPA